MADYILQEAKCTKAELFSKFIGLLIGAGWKDVSSNPTTDFVVLNSTGESNDKDLFIQFRPTNVSNSQPIETTLYGVMSYRLINEYTPNENMGTAGTFGRTTAEAWKPLYIAQSTTANLPLDLELTYRYHVNKNRIIFLIETPESMNLLPVLWYIGLPMNTFTSEPKSRGVVAMSSYYSGYSNSVHISDAVAEMPSLTTSTSKTNYCALPPKSPNSAGIHTPSELLYGDTSEGLRGKIDGIYFLPANSISNGDTLSLGSKRFRASVLASGSNNSFPSLVVIYQIG